MNRARHFQPRKYTKYHETNPNLAWLRADLCFFVVNFLRLFVFTEFLRLPEFYKKALFTGSYAAAFLVLPLLAFALLPLPLPPESLTGRLATMPMLGGTGPIVKVS